MIAQSLIPYYSLSDVPPAEDYKDAVHNLISHKLGHEDTITECDLFIFRAGMLAAVDYINLQNGYKPK